jgi:hypothetical protein
LGPLGILPGRALNSSIEKGENLMLSLNQKQARRIYQRLSGRWDERLVSWIRARGNVFIDDLITMLVANGLTGQIFDDHRVSAWDRVAVLNNWDGILLINDFFVRLEEREPRAPDGEHRHWSTLERHGFMDLDEKLEYLNRDA